MKKKLIISTILVSFLTTITAYAEVVAKEEAAALKNPAMTEGNPHAKAKVEESQLKENFEAKMDAPKFEKEVKQDLNDTVKNNAEKQVNTFEKKEMLKAKKEISTFKKESLTDKEKSVH